MIGMAGRMQDLPGNSDLAQALAALLAGNDDVAIRRNVNVVVLRFRPGLHDGDGGDLDVEHQQGDAFSL